MKTTFFVLLILAGLGCVCGFAQGTTGTTTTTTTTNFVFPPVGVAGSETVSVSLVNIAPASTATTATAPSCAGTVTFANASGKTLAGPTTFTVGTGVIQTVTQTATQLSIGTRGEVLVSVQQTVTRPSTSPCALVFSLQTYDTGSGATHLFMGNTSATVPPAAAISQLFH